MIHHPLLNTFTLETKFKIGFFVVFTCILAILFIEINSSNLNKKLDKQYALAKEIEYGVFSIDQLIGDYIVFESKSDAFYTINNDDINLKIDKHFKKLELAIYELNSYQNPNQDILVKLTDQLNSLKKNSTELVDLLSDRGHRDFGIVGMMRESMHEVESLLRKSEISLYLSIRRNEKDFLLRKDLVYKEKVNEEVHILEAIIQNTYTDKTINDRIATYLSYFNQVVAYDYKIGTHNNKGLIHYVRSDLDVILATVDKIVNDTFNYQYEQNIYYGTLKTLMFSLVIFILLFFGFLFHYRFTQPMQKLSSSIKQIQEGKAALLPKDSIFYNLGNEVSEMALAMKDLLNKLENQKDKLANVAIDAQEASRVKTEFLSTMSHEIRTPLNAVVNIIADLSESEKIKEAHDEDITILKASSEYLLSLINDVLDMNKIDEGKLKLNTKPSDFHEQLKTVCYIFKNRFKSKRIDFIDEINIDKLPQWLEYDSVRLNQVLYNLLGNALKFTNEGYVRFRVQSNFEKGEFTELHFEVEDSGIGIPTEKLPIIFDRFNQADSSNNRSYGGSGLGLSIAQSLVHLMDGNISVQSEVDKGSTFSFDIKLRKVPLASTFLSEKQSTQNNDAKQNPLFSTHILVVDDNNVNLRIAKKIIEKEGYSCHTALNGQEALSFLKENQAIDLILMDLQMPVMDGFEASQHIRSLNSSYNDIPIVAVSASALVESQDQAYLAGMNDYVCKPFTAVELISAVKKNLRVGISV